MTFYEVQFDGNSHFKIPILGTDHYCLLDWKEEETWRECMNNPEISGSLYCTFHVWSKLDSEDDDGTFFSCVYEITNKIDGKRYYLIAFKEIEEFDDILHTVCVTYNKWNILKFFRENLLPFDNGKYFFG